MSGPGDLIAFEPQVRLAVFLVGLAVVAGSEWLWPRRTPAPRRARWTSNLGLVALNTALARLALPVAPVAVAAAIGGEWGLLSRFEAPAVVEGFIAFVLLDVAIYLQHVVFHAIPLLWRLHRVHHSDTVFDVTTGVRFHPFEIILSMLYKSCIVALLGPPVAAVIVFEIVLNATSMFNHGNVKIPSAVDRILRWIVVTPDMHRVHHSVFPEESNRNFGFNLPYWDHLFGTYTGQPRDGHRAMRIGIDVFRAPLDGSLPRLLIQPFKGGVGAYPMRGTRSGT